MLISIYSFWPARQHFQQSLNGSENKPRELGTWNLGYKLSIFIYNNWLCKSKNLPKGIWFRTKDKKCQIFRIQDSSKNHLDLSHKLAVKNKKHTRKVNIMFSFLINSNYIAQSLYHSTSIWNIAFQMTMVKLKYQYESTDIMHFLNHPNSIGFDIHCEPRLCIKAMSVFIA